MSIYTQLTATWPQDRLEAFEERAAIREFDCGLARDDAERVTYNEMVLGQPELINANKA